MKSGALFRQRNAYLLAPYPAENAAEFYQQTRHALLHPLEIVPGTARRPGRRRDQRPDARPSWRNARYHELKAKIWKVLREVPRRATICDRRQRR